MFRFFKRKKSSDDSIADSPSAAEAQEPSAVPVDSPESEPVANDSLVDAVVPVRNDDPGATSGVEPVDPAESVDLAESGDSADPVEPVDPVVSPEPDRSTNFLTAPSEEAGAPAPGAIGADAAGNESPDQASASDTAKAATGKKDAAGGSWLARLRKGLSRTGQSIGGLFVDVKLDDDLYEELETALIMADAGMEATTRLLEDLRNRVRKDRLTDAMQARAALRELLTDHLKPLEKEFPIGSVRPLVMMIAGVNGAGKTTSIGKLANTFQAGGAHVLLAAGDTFRAAAREQLLEWGSRNNVTVIAQEGGDPAAVAFDAVNAGRARKADVVMIDTAGRLPTQLHLMEELKKIKRVVNKADGNAPHEVLLVVDGNSGQNVLAQIRAFDAAIGLTGLVVTKLDGTAKGGILAAVAAGSQGVRPVPVYWIGVGEGIHDLQPFAAHEFAAALIGESDRASA